MSTKKKKRNIGGFTLIEVLFTLGFVTVGLLGILNVFIYQGKMNESVNEMNIAVMLAEQKIEEYFKFPYDEMPVTDETDYVVYRLGRDPVIMTDKNKANETDGAFERIVTITELTNTTQIHVRVNYGGITKSGAYRFSVELETVRGS